MTRTPWGFIQAPDGHLTCTRTARERAERAELGETAIRVLNALGVSLDKLRELNALPDDADLLKALDAT